jgi:hypothetical protein
VPAEATDYLLHGAIVLRPCPKVLHQRLHLLPPHALRHPGIPPHVGRASPGQRRRHAPPAHRVSLLKRSWRRVDRICCLYLRNADRCVGLHVRYRDGEKEFNAIHQLVSDHVELLHCNTFLAFRYSLGIFQHSGRFESSGVLATSCDELVTK